MNRKLWVTIAFFAALFWIWPNFIHEPSHLLALKLQGSDGYINFDYGFPSTPSVTRTAPVNGLIGGLFFILAPSILSVVLVALLWLTRRRAALLTHVALPTYLVADLFINVSRHTHATSDFHFLTVLHPAIGLAISAAVVVLGSIAIATTIPYAAKNKAILRN